MSPKSPLGHLPSRLRYRHLTLLVALGEHRNLHRAANAVHIAQPSATKVVRDLEELFGFPLFNRLPRGMYPTELGRQVLEFARRALTDLRRFSDDLQLRQQGCAGQLCIGASEGAAMGLVACAIIEVKQQCPFLSIKLIDETSERLAALVLANKVDLAIGQFANAHSTAIRFEPLGSEALHLVVGPDHPATRGAELSLSSLVEYPWILPTLPTLGRHVIEQEFAAAGLATPPNIIESTTSLAALQLVRQSKAITILAESLVRDHLRAGLVARLPLALGSPTFGILSRRDAPPNERALEFIDVLRRHAAPTNQTRQSKAI